MLDIRNFIVMVSHMFLFPDVREEPFQFVKKMGVFEIIFYNYEKFFQCKAMHDGLLNIKVKHILSFESWFDIYPSRKFNKNLQHLIVVKGLSENSLPLTIWKMLA